MAKKSTNFDEKVETLRAHGFVVSPYGGTPQAVLVSKQGVAAVLATGSEEQLAFVEPPGALVGGEVARLLDRGYQKFLKTARFEIPATAGALEGIHAFTEELKLLVGSVSLYNASLGTTSDLYQYDRLRGREAVVPTASQPWEQTGGH